MAHELGMDVDEVLSWPRSKVKGWVTYLRVKDDLMAEAQERARRKSGIGRR